MAQPSYRRALALVGVVTCSLTLAAAAGAPAVAGASTHKHQKGRNASQGSLVKVVKSKKYGQILVDGSGRTLYFATTGNGKPFRCGAGCAGVWPPLLTKGNPRAGSGVSAKVLRAVKRGKSLQVTYHGHPLYLFAGDTGAGQVKGEGIRNFGGTWYLLSVGGAPVKAALAAAKNASGGSNASSGSKGSSGSSW